MTLSKSLPLSLIGLGLLAVSAQAQETVKIGVIQPLTGSVAYNGTTDINGSKLALDEINAKGGVLGKKLELVIEDGQCKPANSVNAAEKLIQRDKVAALSGAFCSSATLAVMPVAENYKIPLVTGVSSSASLTEKGNRWFFRATETDALLAKSFAKILFDQLKLPSDFYTILTKLKASGADGAFVAAETQDGSIFVKQKAEFGLQLKVFGVGSWATADFMKLTGASSEGIYAAVPYASTMDTPKNKAFVEAYTARYKEAPGKYSAAGYNAINILAAAINRAGSTDAEKIRVNYANSRWGLITVHTVAI